MWPRRIAKVLLRLVALFATIRFTRAEPGAFPLPLEDVWPSQEPTLAEPGANLLPLLLLVVSCGDDDDGGGGGVVMVVMAVMVLMVLMFFAVAHDTNSLHRVG